MKRFFVTVNVVIRMRPGVMKPAGFLLPKFYVEAEDLSRAQYAAAEIVGEFDARGDMVELDIIVEEVRG